MSITHFARKSYDAFLFCSAFSPNVGYEAISREIIFVGAAKMAPLAGMRFEKEERNGNNAFR